MIPAKRFVAARRFQVGERSFEVGDTVEHGVMLRDLLDLDAGFVVEETSARKGLSTSKKEGAA